MLISFLRENVGKYRFNIFRALADADTLLANVAVQEVSNGSDVVVHADKRTNESRQSLRVKDVN